MKPAQEPTAAFESVTAALVRAPQEALMVGDSIEDDVRGAIAAGLTGVSMDRFHRTRATCGIAPGTLYA